MILEKVIKKKKTVHYIIGIDEVGRAASKRRASPDCQYIIGIDEVGRGALAGPVTVAALALPLKSKIKIQKSKLQLKNKKSKVHLRDSKKLSAKQREDWFKFIKKSALCCSGRHTAQYIEPAVH
ncbi:MAG: hypothetical protein KY053_00265, partial [Candidatus Liptonbacteria bacterium]|nr:hypothetical protein [Candidatus Liptonbacteria bacterium]